MSTAFIFFKICVIVKLCTCTSSNCPPSHSALSAAHSILQKQTAPLTKWHFEVPVPGLVLELLHWWNIAYSCAVISKIPEPGIDKHFEYIYLQGEQQKQRGGIRSDTAATLMSIQETQAAQSKAQCFCAAPFLTDGQQSEDMLCRDWCCCKC